MRRRRELLVLGVVATFPVAMFGQILQPNPYPCQGVAGFWTDDFGYQWLLTQSGTNISGTVSVTDGCPVSWPVSGTLNLDGSFTLTATDPGPNPGYCTGQFSYSGTLSGIDCASGSGTWTSDSPSSGPWNWSKDCDGPDSEYTSYSALGWNPTASTEYYWQANLISAKSFGGRTVYESDAGGYVPIDTCYYTGSPAPRNGPIPYNEAYVDWNGGYNDLVGWTPFAVVWYRDNRPPLGLPMPCSFANHQNMNMKCSSGTPGIFYKQNLLEGVIGLPTRVESWRDGNLAARTF